MAPILDCTARRILEFPAVHPCEGISPATLLDSLIAISHRICNHKFKFFATQGRNARETIRRIEILSIIFEEIKTQLPWCSSDSMCLCLSDLHPTFQKLQFLMEDCTREGARLWVLMNSSFVAMQFLDSTRDLAAALDVLNSSLVDFPFEIKELIEMLSRQARTAKMELDSRDADAVEMVILLMDQFKNNIQPEKLMIKKALDHLGVRTWVDCNKEIEFLIEEMEWVYCSDCNQRELPLLSSLLGLLNYSRAVLFEDCEYGFFDENDAKKGNLETLICLNPEDFRCPISRELMIDPVTVSTGHTYDRASIQKWLKTGHLLCPKTGERLKTTELVPNTSLSKVIRRFCEEYGVSWAKSRKKNHDISNTASPGSPVNASAMKFLSEFVVSRLCYGTDDQKNRASYEIRLLSKSNLFNRSCLIESGAVRPLLDLLHSAESEIQENGISSLLNLSKQSNGQTSIVINNGLNPILSVLQTGRKLKSRQIAAAAVFYLSYNQEQRKAIGESRGAIPALLQLIKEGTSCGKKNSLLALLALLFYKRNRQRAVQSGAVPVLLRVLTSSNTVELKTYASAVLSTLAVSFDGSMEILKSDGVRIVVGLLKSMETQNGKEHSVSILHSLCLNGGGEVASILAKEHSFMSTLRWLSIDGKMRASRVVRSLTKIVHGFCEKGA